LKRVKEIITKIENDHKEREKSPEELRMIKEIDELKDEMKKLYHDGTRRDILMEKVARFQYLQKRVEFSPRNLGGTTSVVV